MAQLLCLQHTYSEGPGMINDWALQHEHRLHRFMVPLQNVDSLNQDEYDGVIVLGGPMGVYEENDYPWLMPEKQWLEEFIKTRKPMLGICLGAQLIASALGADVYAMEHSEIGWYDLDWKNSATKYSYLDINRSINPVLHWHGDMLDIPDGADSLASSEACGNQGFVFGDNVLALQYHLELKSADLELYIDNSKHKLKEGGHFIQSAGNIRNLGKKHLDANNRAMEAILNNWLQPALD